MPVVDAIVPDYADDVRFIAIGGNSDFAATEVRAGELLANTEWGYDESVWDLYGVRGQPVSFLITGDDVIVDNWFGAVGDDAIRSALDTLVALDR